MGKRKQMEPEQGDAKNAAEAAAAAEEPEKEASDEESSDYSEEEDSGNSDSAPEVSDEEDGEDSPDEDPFDQINVNFEFFDPKESDFHGLKALLHTYLDGEQYDGSALVETIIAQSAVGTVVRSGEDDDPIAVMTVLNTAVHKQQPFMAQIRQHVLGKCSDKAARDAISKAWDSPSTGLIINERLINCPPQLAPPLVQALFDEVQWATEDLEAREERDSFKFKHFILMTRVFSDPLPEQQPAAAAAAGPGSSKPPAGPRKMQQQQQQQQQRHSKKQKGTAPAAAAATASAVIVYVRPEDEFLHQQASASFTFPVEGRAVAKDELQPLRLVLLLPAAKVPAARAALDAVVGNMAAQQR